MKYFSDEIFPHIFYIKKQNEIQLFIIIFLGNELENTSWRVFWKFYNKLN